MEEEESSHFSQFLNVSDFLGLALWQWQSDLDPWKEKDSIKWTWKNYSNEECAILEQAFSLGQEVANIKDYEVDLQKMLQVCKGDKHRLRRVRRLGTSRLSMEMSKPVAIAQKTMNEAFGTIQQFLDYIMMRTPEAYGLYQRLKELPLECKETEFEDVIQEVINCIERGAENREKTQTRSGSAKKSCVDQGKRIVDEIRKNSKSLGDFFKTILKIYTMNTFMFRWLNELLRSEDWEEINVLTPYLVCLVFIFKLSAYIIQLPRGFASNIRGFVGKQKLCLYRGTELTKEDIALYDKKKIKYFSWNGVTSTSKKKSEALNFIMPSATKLSVLFTIKTDFASPEDCEGMIDVTKVSEFPKEQEIILAPGTVFQLLKTRETKKDFYEINLKVIKKIEKIKENITFLGALHNQAMSENKAIIEEFPSQRSFQLLGLLKGNKFIRKLEIINSGIEEHIIEQIENMREKTNLKKQNIKLINNTIVVSGLSVLAQYFSPENLNNILISNKIRFQKRAVKLEEKTQDWKTSLILREEALKKLQKDGFLKEFWENIKQDIKAQSLEVSMLNMQIENSEFRDFLESIKDMKHLESLTVRINSNNVEPTEDLTHFCSMIESLSALKQLSIELALSDKALQVLKKALSSLKSLQQLRLDFKSCKQTSDEGLDHLKTALLSCEFLQHLSLDLKNCDKVSDEGLYQLKTALQSLTFLRHLSLDLTDCIKISDDGFNHLHTSLGSLKSLQYLSLHFNLCNGFSDKGLHHLKTALLSLTSLKHLSLDFTRCDRISDEGLTCLHLALTFCKSLQYLYLSLARCFKISDKGLNHLITAIYSLESLQHLSLNFTKCDKISDEGLKHIKMELIQFKNLQHLSLNFRDCFRITNEGLHHVKSLLIFLSSLQHLSLDFVRCNMISDEGLNNLHAGLTRLKSLQHLSLSFGWCNELSDDVLNHLKIDLISLTSLQYLSVDFTCCDKITDEGLKSLASSLTPFISLQTLSFNFSACQQISDEGLKHFKDVLTSLPNLQYLNVDFSDCEQISHSTLNHFKDELKSIPYLECHQSLFT